MEYYEAINTLDRLRRVRPKLGTETTASLLDFLDNPHDGMTAVQIAGSNGKGSTARVLEQILHEAGLKVGLYTSPDLNDLRERIRVKGKKIPKSDVVSFVEETWPYVTERSVENDTPTFFETFTGLALWHFNREEVDVAILEVGIGGQHDATSVVDPVAAAITSVSLEHTDILGDTVEEIARDQAQIVPVGVQPVTGATGKALDTIRKETDVVTVGVEDADVVARETGMVSKTEASVSLLGQNWEVETPTPLLGSYQATNAGIAATLARQIGKHVGTAVSERVVGRGIRNVRWPGRFEVMSDEPFVVLDGAHNPDAFSELTTLLNRFEYDDLHLVFGAMRDKDHKRICRFLPSIDQAYLAEPDVERAQDTDTLAAVFNHESDTMIKEQISIRGALDSAMQAAEPEDCVLVTGSLYVVAEARNRWTRMPEPVQTNSSARAHSALQSSDVPSPERDGQIDQMIHRTIKIYAQREEATNLKETMLLAGGACAVSGIVNNEHVRVVLSGTLNQFCSLVRRLHNQSDGSHLATQLSNALELDSRSKTEAKDTNVAYPWEEKTAVMGILNVTPDSFYDGGDYETIESAVARAEEMVTAGADVVDVGGESTRPGADSVSVAAEHERVLPVVEQLNDLDALISVDTRKPEIARAALEAGANMVNDVTGLEDAAMRRVVANHEVPAVMMHSLSTPVDPDHHYNYDDVVDDVLKDLTERILLAERAGIDRSKLILDPGLGFGKRTPESFELLNRLREFRALGTNLMIGHSHKSMFEDISCNSDDRLVPTVAATALAAERGADLIRVHDVAENVAAVATAENTIQTR